MAVVEKGVTEIVPAPAYYGFVVGSVIRAMMKSFEGCPSDVTLKLANGKGFLPRHRLLLRHCDIQLLGVIKVVTLPANMPNHPSFYQTFYFSPDPENVPVPDSSRRIIGLIIGYPQFRSITKKEIT